MFKVPKETCFVRDVCGERDQLCNRLEFTSCNTANYRVSIKSSGGFKKIEKRRYATV